MKKHIMIAGVTRAGKSTVSKLISKRLGYQHISMDAIIAGFEKNFPEVGIDTEAHMPSMDIMKNISHKIAPFIQSMIDDGDYEECDYGMVIDIHQLLPEDYITYIDRNKCDIFYFVTADCTREERFEILKNYDTPDDYSYYMTDEEKYESCGEMIEQSEFIMRECRKYGLPYFETTHNRERVIEQFMDMLESMEASESEWRKR